MISTARLQVARVQLPNSELCAAVTTELLNSASNVTLQPIAAEKSQQLIHRDANVLHDNDHIN